MMLTTRERKIYERKTQHTADFFPPAALVRQKAESCIQRDKKLSNAAFTWNSSSGRFTIHPRQPAFRVSLLCLRLNGQGACHVTCVVWMLMNFSIFYMSVLRLASLHSSSLSISALAFNEFPNADQSIGFPGDRLWGFSVCLYKRSVRRSSDPNGRERQHAACES